MGEYGISKLSIIPGRAEPSDKAENITQILFGEQYEVLDQLDKWIQIKTLHDGYVCWIDRKQHMDLATEELQLLNSMPAPRTLDLLGIAKDYRSENYFNLPLCSQLPFYKKRKFRVGKCEFLFKGTRSKEEKSNLIRYARLYINSPYLWGGRTPFGIDCSGFTQASYLLIGINLPRDAYQQAEVGTEVKDIQSVQPGDLVFFSKNGGKINHVGIALEDGKIIHASGKVRIDKLDETGIYHRDTGEYTHSLDKIRRIL